jgi:GTP pyrophosphokinase
VIEVQIRTDWMHRVAEYGLASHWLYKDEMDRKAGATSYYRIAWMNCVKASLCPIDGRSG